MVMHDLLSTPSVLEKPTVDEYVQDLVPYLKSVHQQVCKEHKRINEQQQAKLISHFGEGPQFQVGDYVLLKRPAAVTKSLQRNQPPYYNRLFQIVSQVGQELVRAYTLCDAASGDTNLGFAQPVSADRLLPRVIQPLVAPVGDDQERTRISINGRSASVKAIAIDGRVHVMFDGETNTELVDLTNCNYQWLN